MTNHKDKNGFYKMYPKYNSGHLRVSKIHSVYFEEAGNPKGIPVIHLHGGPGYWNKPKHRKLFDPRKFRVILADQRGGGRSTPFGETKENTTSDLIGDIEKLREHLGLGKVIVSGGSWGCTLALLYAEKYPNNVSRLLLRSIWLARKEDAVWLTKGESVRKFFPDLWDKRMESSRDLAVNPESGLDELMKILQKSNFSKQQKAAAIVANWEDQFGRIYKKIKLVPFEKIEEKMILYAKIFLHFDSNNNFLQENQILKNISKIKHIPTNIVHGRYDMVCPLYQAWELHKSLPKSNLEIVHLAGHSDTALSKEIVKIADKIVK